MKAINASDVMPKHNKVDSIINFINNEIQDRVDRGLILSHGRKIRVETWPMGLSGVSKEECENVKKSFEQAGWDIECFQWVSFVVRDEYTLTVR